MKKKLKVMGAIAIVALAGLAFFACGDASEPAYSHTWGEWEVTTAPTCTTAGVETMRCTREGCDGEETRTIAALGHTWGEWEVTTPATYGAAGEEARICTRCQTPETQPIPRRTLQMAWIPAGTFTRGDDDTESSNAQPAHEVTLTQGFFMGATEVTRQQWYDVMETRPWEAETWGEDDHPVTHITWFDAVAFANELSELAGLTPAYTITDRVPATGHPITSAVVEWNREANGYRLPTEAEWEYACRAGTTTAWYWEPIQDRARFWNSPAVGAPATGTMPVGSFDANVWGLYDMHGNVWEWVWDRFESYAALLERETEPVVDPTGASSGSYRVVRGGSWADGARGLRSAGRNVGSPGLGWFNDLGFRVVRP